MEDWAYSLSNFLHYSYACVIIVLLFSSCISFKTFFPLSICNLTGIVEINLFYVCGRVSLLSSITSNLFWSFTQIVFRSESWKYKKLMNECDEFLKHIASLEVLVGNVEAEDLQQVIDRTHSWQV
jgi:hypothetical protein